MIKSALACVILLAQFSVVRAKEGSVHGDIMLPERPYAKFRRLLAVKLGPTTFDCGRIIVMPAFEPEFAVSVHSSDVSNTKRTYYVTCVTAADNLWQKSDMVQYPRRAEQVRTDRIDAEIPETTAKLLRDAWLVMLQAAKNKPAPSSEGMGSTPSGHNVYGVVDSESATWRANSSGAERV